MSEKKKRKINWVKILFWVSVIALAIIWYHGLLDPIKAQLNSKALSIKLGKVSFTPFKLLKAFVVLIFALWASGKISILIEKGLRRSSHVSRASRALAVKIINISLYVISGLICLYVLGLDITALTVFGGAIGIGIGFGLQKIASNFISGIILLFERSINEGDLVDIAGGGSGFVRRISGRYTLIETYDGKEIMVPNEDFITSRVTNWTFSDTSGRIDIKVSVAYDSDVRKACDIILNSAKAHPLCSRLKEPSCQLIELTPSISFLLQLWIDDVTKGRGDATHDILLEIWDKFKEAGIKMPNPAPTIDLKLKGN